MALPVSSKALVERVQRGGITDPALAEYALRSTLSVLSQLLTDDEAGALAAQLPDALAEIVEESDYRGDFDAESFYKRVERRATTPPGVAREQADVALRAIGQEMMPELRARLARALPEQLALRLLPSDVGKPPPHPATRHAPALRTIARGRPGSRRPLSESAPPAGHFHSVARNPDPHGDTKLSGSRGLTQERHRESLATGKPPAPDRPISEASDE